MKRVDYILKGHKCEKIADAMMSTGREVWFGRLREPLSKYPEETHCIHIKTPIKEVVLGVNISDVGWLAVFAQILNGVVVNQNWLRSVEGIFRDRAKLKVTI